MTTSRSKRIAFRPCLGDAPLEDRVVLATVGTAIVRTHDSLLLASFLNRLNDSLSGQNLRKSVNQQVRGVTRDFQRLMNTQVRQLFANGRPTAEQKADFLALSNGALDAVAVRLSSLASLLPQGSNQLVPGIQRALLGSQGGSLASRIEQAVQSNRLTRTGQTLNSALNQAVNRATTQRLNSFNTFLGSSGLGMSAVDSNGVTIPISQFIGNQIVTQLGNTLGALSQSFPTVATSMLFPNGATTATTAAQQAFTNQALSALSIASAQLGAGLSLAPGLTSSFVPQLQSALFGLGTNNTSLLSALQGLPTTSSDFNTAASSAFNNGFQNLSTHLSSFFNLPASQSFSLPTTNTTGLLGSPFVALENGFNNGFGTGFPGFGIAPTGFNANFGMGFNHLIGSGNSNFGFNVPILDFTSLPTGTGTGIPTGTTGTGLPTGTGTGLPTGTGTGTGLPTGTGSGTGLPF